LVSSRRITQYAKFLFNPFFNFRGRLRRQGNYLDERTALRAARRFASRMIGSAERFTAV
jgi:hypothetical protein